MLSDFDREMILSKFKKHFQYLVVLDVGKNVDPTSIQIYKELPHIKDGIPLLGVGDSIVIQDALIKQLKFYEMNYVVQCEKVFNLMNKKALKNNALLVIDNTGIGEAFKDILRESWGLDPLCIWSTSGNDVSIKYMKNNDPRFSMSSRLDLKQLDKINVPKNDMVEAAKIAMEQKQVVIGEGLEYGDEFFKQLIEFTGKTSSTGYTSYNNSDDEIHDDWVVCFMLRSWVRKYYERLNKEEEIPLTLNQNKVADLGIY